MKKQLNFKGKIEKVDETLGLVFGYAIVCTENGEPYFDTQDDHIPEDTMLKAATDFMKNSRQVNDMHVKDAVLPGSVVFAFPLMKSTLEAFGLQGNTTGLMIAMQPESDEIMQKYRDGEYTGFSIGGFVIESYDEVINA